MIKRLVIAVLALGVLCGGLVFFNVFRAQAIEDFFAGMRPPPVTISAQPAEAITWQPVIAAFGTVNAARGVEVASETSGVVREILFSANEPVEQGQVMIQIDDSVEQAELLSAQAELARDEEAFQRASELSQRGVTSTATFDEAEAALNVSRANLQRLEATLELKSTEAPFTGTPGIPRIEVGQYVTAGTVVATLQDLDHMRVDFTVPERQATGLQVGQQLRVGEDDGALDLTGTITGIDPRSDPNSRLVAIRGQIDNPETALLPGQFVRIEVLLPREPNVIVVPQTAVVASLYGDYAYIVEEALSADGGEPARTVRQEFLQTGRRSGGVVEVLSGIAVGDVIVTSGQNKLYAGAGVIIDNTVVPEQAPAVEMAQQ